GIVNSNGSSSVRTKIGAAVSNELSANLISGNASNGIYITSCSHIDIYKNYIGIKGNGTPQGNGSEGIRIEGNASNINIGAIGAGNVVGGNSTDNIILFENGGAPNNINIIGNHIGIGADGTTSLGGGRGVELLGVLTRNVYISQNVIACNLVKGIGLNYLLSTANESIAPPVITEALTTRVSGTANAGANVEIYVDNSTCSTGSKQGSVYLGTTTANATGAWTFTTNLSLGQGKHITAIQHAGSLNTNTSEFSLSQTVNHLPTTTTSTNTKTTLEDTQINFTVADFSTTYGYADTDLDAFAGIKIIDVSGSGTLYLDANTNNLVDVGEAITGTPNLAVTLADIPKLKFKPTDNTSGSPYASFYFEVFDGKEYSQSPNVPSMNIVVTPVNDLPTSADFAIGINAPLVLEDTDFALSQVLFPFVDVDAGDVFSRLQIVTLPTKGTLTFSGTPVVAGQIFSVSDFSALLYRAVLNESGTSYTTFTFKVIDSQDGASLTHTATINVTAVNDAPTINAITPPQSDISANSNPVKLKLTGIGVGGGADEANTQQILSVTATSNKPIITPTISATMDTLTYRVSQAVTQDTDVTITITVQDNGGIANGGIDTKTVQFTVTVVPNLLTPYNLSATVASASSIQLAWEDENLNVSSYEIYRTTTSETNPFQMIGTSTTKSYTDNAGLVIGTYYIYKVRSISAVGYSEYSNLGAVELVNVSASPTNLQATVPTTDIYDKINLTWTDNSNDEEGFRLERKSVYSGNLFEEIDILPANTTTYTDTELLPNVKYTYRIRSYNDNGQSSAYSNEANTRTNKNAQMPTPLPPFDLEATSVSTRQINLSWEYSINPDVIYLVERSTDGTNFTEISEFVTASLSSVKAYIDTVDVLQGTLYHYRVRASTGGGLSGYSNVDTARAICNLQDLAIVRTDNGKEVICEGKSAAMSIVSDIAGATYQWRRNGVIIPNAKFETFYASQTGVYTCTIAVDNCQAISVNSLFVAVLNEPEALTVLEQNGELLASINDADAYQWYFDYRPITGATSRNYKPTNAGVYYVVATVESCVSTSNTYFYAVLANETTNISQYIYLAPNPARLQTEVRFALPTMGDYAMEVLDTKGKTWLRNAGKKTDVELRQTISLAKVPAGVYLIKLRIGNQQGYKKLVVGE
ncbi:MAG: T9SS C-terminal target domain-containing protein, partial [Bacteroidetes bacterium]